MQDGKAYKVTATAHDGVWTVACTCEVKFELRARGRGPAAPRPVREAALRHLTSHPGPACC